MRAYVIRCNKHTHAKKFCRRTMHLSNHLEGNHSKNIQTFVLEWNDCVEYHQSICPNASKTAQRRHYDYNTMSHLCAKMFFDGKLWNWFQLE